MPIVSGGASARPPPAADLLAPLPDKHCFPSHIAVMQPSREENLPELALREKHGPGAFIAAIFDASEYISTDSIFIVSPTIPKALQILSQARQKQERAKTYRAARMPTDPLMSLVRRSR
jgi:hypothetical protein